MSLLGTATALLMAATTLTAADPTPPPDPSTPAAAIPQPPAGGPRWVWPLDPAPEVVAPFDPPDSPWLSGHRGVDLLSAVAAPVRSPADGRIAFSGAVAAREVLVIDHGAGLRSTFEPVASDLAVGVEVARGETVGVLTTAAGHCAPAACLHWGVLRADHYLDPLAFLRRQPVRLLPLE